MSEDIFLYSIYFPYPQTLFQYSYFPIFPGILLHRFKCSYEFINERLSIIRARALYYVLSTGQHFSITTRKILHAHTESSSHMFSYLFFDLFHNISIPCVRWVYWLIAADKIPRTDAPVFRFIVAILPSSTVSLTRLNRTAGRWASSL